MQNSMTCEGSFWILILEIWGFEAKLSVKHYFTYQKSRRMGDSLGLVDRLTDHKHYLKNYFLCLFCSIPF